jgi:hypothetical protein
LELAALILGSGAKNPQMLSQIKLSKHRPNGDRRYILLFQNNGAERGDSPITKPPHPSYTQFYTLLRNPTEKEKIRWPKCMLHGAPQMVLRESLVETYIV